MGQAAETPEASEDNAEAQHPTVLAVQPAGFCPTSPPNESANRRILLLHHAFSSKIYSSDTTFWSCNDSRAGLPSSCEQPPWQSDAAAAVRVQPR